MCQLAHLFSLLLKFKYLKTFISADLSKSFHRDQWVTAEIDMKDGKITHYVNGEEILSYTNLTYNTENSTSTMIMIVDDITV